MTEVDCIIVGQGLAGSAMAWQLLCRGQRLCLIDPGEAVTSSKIAAGLITPITGKRAVLSWRFFEFYHAAVAFYTEIERQSGCSFFRELPHYRLFQNATEAERFENQIAEAGQLPGFKRLIDEAGEHASVRDWQGGFEMAPAAQLDTAGYLSALQTLFDQSPRVERWNRWLTPDDLKLTEQGIELPERQIRGRHLVFCRGAAERSDTMFPELPFLPAKGEILTLSSESRWDRVYHRGLWIAPGRDQTIRIGATYDSQHLDQIPTPAGRDYLLTRLRSFMSHEGTVLEHQAAVRPALNNQRPVIARHAQFPHVSVLNGLGSKGALQAPLLAERLASAISGETDWACVKSDWNESE